MLPCRPRVPVEYRWFDETAPGKLVEHSSPPNAPGREKISNHGNLDWNQSVEPMNFKIQLVSIAISQKRWLYEDVDRLACLRIASHPHPNKPERLNAHAQASCLLAFFQMKVEHMDGSMLAHTI